MANFEQTFKKIDDLLYMDSGANSEIEYKEESSWIIIEKFV